jgi:hypothetical protein
VHEPSGIVYPVCPGTAAGTYDPACHRPVNFDYVSILEDLTWVVDALAEVNPTLEHIFTVSPVPLVATHTDQSVIVATTYSKSVLRAVCGDVERLRPQVTYFPSYEIISAAQSFGQYLGSNLRDITDRGIVHVMSVFERTFVDRTGPTRSEVAPSTMFAAVADALSAECDELFNDLA